MADITVSQIVDDVMQSTTAAEIATLILPAQTGNSGKYLTTDGTLASWADSGGASPDGFFDVEDYGAVHDGSTNDAAAINLALAAAYNAGGGTVYFPNGHYKVSGSLGTANSVLKIPAVVASEYPFQPKTIRLIGESKGSFDVETNGTYTGGVLIDGSTGITASGTVPALLACTPFTSTQFDSSGCGFCDVEVEIENMAFCVKANPDICVLNLANCIGANIGDEVLVLAKWSASGVAPFSGWPAYGPVEPVQSGGIGIYMPQGTNYRKCIIGAAQVMGFYNGVAGSEHLNFDRTRITYCRNAIALIAGPHPVTGNVSVENCNYALVNTSTSLVVVDLLLQSEIGTTAASPGAWWVPVYTVYAGGTTSYKGILRYAIVTAGTGAYTDPTFNITQDALVLIRLDSSTIAAKTLTASTVNGLTIDTSTGTLDITNGTTVACEVLQNSQSTAYTCVLGDAGKHIYHPSSDNNARTFTIPANSSVAYPIGTALTFVNEINTVTIAITTDTLVMAGTGSTGSRTLAANGIATALKVTSTRWVISGTGLS